LIEPNLPPWPDKTLGPAMMPTLYVTVGDDDASGG
jgi:hypothetical protein